MYWFSGTSTAQQIISTRQQIINTVKLPVLSKLLMKSMVTKGLALILSHKIKPFTNHLL